MFELNSSLSEASLWFILFGLTLCQLGLPLPETPFIIAAGVVSQRVGLAPHVPIVGSCLAVLGGDLLLYYLARAIGLRALERRPLRWLVPVRALPRAHLLFERHGAMTVFVSRFVSGVRMVAFVFAGMRQMPLFTFVAWDGLAILLTVPVFAGLGFLFSTNAQALTEGVTQANHVILGVLALVVVGYAAMGIARWRNAKNPGSAASARDVPP